METSNHPIDAPEASQTGTSRFDTQANIPYGFLGHIQKQHTPPPEAFWSGLINQWFPLIRPAILNPYFVFRGSFLLVARGPGVPSHEGWASKKKH